MDSAQAEVYAITEKRNSEDYAPLSEIMAGVLDEIEAIGNWDAGSTAFRPASPTSTSSPTVCTPAR